MLIFIKNMIKRFCLYRNTLDTNTFIKIFDNKSIAIVGNSTSLFKKNYGDSIDNNEIVIRFNQGFITDTKKQGSRTTIYAMSLNIDEKKVIEEFNPKNIIWLTSKIQAMEKYNKHFLKRLYIVRFFEWFKIKRKIKNKRPSSGFILFNFILNNANYKEISLYGFDFFVSPNFYDKNKGSKKHNFDYERDFILDIIESHKNIRLYR